MLELARACLAVIQTDRDYATGLAMDGKRPFGNSGFGALMDTLEEAGVVVDHTDLAEDERKELAEYARELWADLPRFLANDVQLSLRGRTA